MYAYLASFTHPFPPTHSADIALQASLLRDLPLVVYPADPSRDGLLRLASVCRLVLSTLTVHGVFGVLCIVYVVLMCT